MELEEGEIGEDGFGEIYVNNLYSHSTVKKSLKSPNLNNVDDDHMKLEDSRVINGSEFNMETDLIRALMSSYGLSPVKSSVDNKDGDSTDDFALELESQLLEEEIEFEDLNVNVKSMDDNVVRDEDGESEDSLVLVLNDDSDFIQVDSNLDKIKIDEEELYGDLGFEFCGELGSTTTVGDHSPLPVYKSVNPVAVAAAPGKPQVVTGVPAGVPTADVKLGGASVSGIVFPHHMKVFDINIDDIEDKIWRKPGADVSNFFNYGLNEDKWKDYSKEMQQLHLRSSRKIHFANQSLSKKNHEHDLASNVTAKTDVQYQDHVDLGGRNNAIKTKAYEQDIKMSNKISASVSGTDKQIPCMTAKPSRFSGSGTIIEIVIQDSMDEDDRKMGECKEDPEPLDRCSRSRTVHKNIHGDRILPYPLDGAFINGTSDTHHRERFGDDYPRRIRGKPNHQWEKVRTGWKLKQPYNQDNEEHKNLRTKNRTLKKTPYHSTNHGYYKELERQYNLHKSQAIFN